ncbi:ABC transporter substrate-binding protein [Paraburkholderia lycopersici]|uniref:ABC-type nitrate/sulfonate/bicarbonate transport system, substrate-binding protein n=1 Tax=Paraburkholderia lycopersici TaxID=416944 RepID=A0A1G6HAL0_9BURK|nr:ABC transporter substrate-binding protein [Paraburkholderia lycopersici]SDB91329.1 ABC-type nitrate/sulfonate/bicarbonate transport system, substrate-binding protein [Paraburkholderia lycopersici]
MSKALDTLWYTRCPVPTGLGIAFQRGWLEDSFRDQHTELKSLRESNERAVRESHFDHTLQNSVRHGGNIPAIWARSAGRATRVIGLSWADEIQLILTLPDSGIKTVRDLKGRRFGLPKWEKVQIDFTRAQAIRGLENALKLDGLTVSDVELVDFTIDGGYSDEPAQRIAGTQLFSGRRAGSRSSELVGLLRNEVDAIFLKGAQAALVANQFGLHTVIDTGSHPDPLIRSNNGTPRTLTVDVNLLDQHFDSAVRIVEQVLRAEQWAHQHQDETRRFLARETNSSEFYVTAAYSENAHLRLRTDFAEQSVLALQDFSDFLLRWKFIPERVDVHSWLDQRPFEKALERLHTDEKLKAA